MSEERQAELKADVASASALVVAIENYKNHQRLDGAAVAAAALAQALAEGGIAHRFPDGLRGGKAQDLADQILKWMTGAGRDDRLFLYWTGHGMREADGFYLMTEESPANNFNQTNAVEPRSLAKGAANSKAAQRDADR